MPKKAFFRLDDTKREEIVNNAMQLFIDYPYEDINMEMVFTAISVHPGTYYRYFEHKDELYCFLVQNVMQKRADFFNNHTQDFLLQVFLTGLFDEDMGMGNEPLSELEIKFLETVLSIPEGNLFYIYMNALKGETAALIKDMLRRMRLDGYLRPDIDDELVSFMFETMQFNLVLFFREHGIKDIEMQNKISKYFADFFGHGLVDDDKYARIVSDFEKAKK
ncbi:MAG: TetR/AcrR family transcriptional regulator [Clostridiales Family XIII bacterium]|jgi:AcrR family transcriptional regulator|nr:TetR/AcrR family transcriptional regulator [Clostridiales Family XIII bacterium]